VRALLSKGSAATSRWSLVELASALIRRCREGSFSQTERDRALKALQEDFNSLVVVELTSEVSRMAVTLMTRHLLRPGDAVQLASCLTLKRRLEAPVHFIAYDSRLNTAASHEGLVLPTRPKAA